MDQKRPTEDRMTALKASLDDMTAGEAIPADDVLAGLHRRILTMSKHKPKKVAPAGTAPDPVTALRRALAGRKKKELVDLLLAVAQSNLGILRRLNVQLEVVVTPEELAAATRQAIADATHFDKRDINRNFDFDYEAYDEVARNLERLIGMGQLRLAMQLALELMEQGSYQVAMSDEGLMRGEIENCLSVVLKNVEECDLPAAEIIAWCCAMLQSDQVRFIAREPIESLRNQVRSVAAE